MQNLDNNHQRHYLGRPMDVETISYDEGNDSFDAMVAYPAGSQPAPTVLVCHAWGGRDTFAEDKAKALAALGYVGAAIDVYGIGKRGTDYTSNAALMNGVLADPARLHRRLQAAQKRIADLERVDSGRMGAIGFCFGGMCAILMARIGLSLRSVVSFHGLLKIAQPLETNIQTKILVLHGQDDPMATPADIGLFAAEMKRIDADWQLHAYPKTVHAFTNPQAHDPDLGMVYNSKVASDAWREMTRFFSDTLGSD